MKLELLSHIAYMPKHGLKKWRRVGRLFYDMDEHECKMFLTGFHQGLCVAIPRDKQQMPYLQGDITTLVGVWEDKVEHLHVGFVTTSEMGKEYGYTIRLDAMPLVSFQKPAGVWLKVDLEDK